MPSSSDLQGKKRSEKEKNIYSGERGRKKDSNILLFQECKKERAKVANFVLEATDQHFSPPHVDKSVFFVCVQSKNLKSCFNCLRSSNFEVFYKVSFPVHCQQVRNVKERDGSSKKSIQA